MPSCERIEFRMQYFHVALAPEPHGGFAVWLAAFDACRRDLTTYEESIALGKAACGDDPDPALAPEVPEELVQAIPAPRADRRA